MPVRLLLVDDHEVVRSGLRMLLDSEQDVQIVGEAGAAPEELLTAIRAAAKGEVYLYPSLATLLVKDYMGQDPDDREARILNGLTERELGGLGHLAGGASNSEIRDTLP